MEKESDYIQIRQQEEKQRANIREIKHSGMQD